MNIGSDLPDVELELRWTCASDNLNFLRSREAELLRAIAVLEVQ